MARTGCQPAGRQGRVPEIWFGIIAANEENTTRKKRRQAESHDMPHVAQLSHPLSQIEAQEVLKPPDFGSEINSCRGRSRFNDNSINKIARSYTMKWVVNPNRRSAWVKLSPMTADDSTWRITVIREELAKWHRD